MKLLVDAGNSCLKWAWLDDDGLKSGGRLLHGNKTAKAVLAEAWDELENVPDEVIVANVAGEAFRRSLTTYCKKRWSLKADYLTAMAEQCGVKNSYEKPETLGVDRWLAMLGARAIKQTPCCVIDCGTALTIDAVDKQGRHMGGLIMPGMHLMRQSLIDAASGIKERPNLSAIRPSTFLASDTDNAIIVGTLYTSIAAIDRIVNDVRAELGTAMQCYITGGEAALFLPLIDPRIRHEPDLVFKGMQAILQESQPAKENRSDEAQPNKESPDEARPDETTLDETAASETGKPRKKPRPRRKNRARKENKSDEHCQTAEASQPVEESSPSQANKADESNMQSEENQTHDADKLTPEDDKTREQAL